MPMSTATRTNDADHFTPEIALRFAAPRPMMRPAARGRLTGSSVLAGSGTLAKFRIVLSLARQSDFIFP